MLETSCTGVRVERCQQCRGGGREPKAVTSEVIIGSCSRTRQQMLTELPRESLNSMCNEELCIRLILGNQNIF